MVMWCHCVLRFSVWRRAEWLTLAWVATPVLVQQRWHKVIRTITFKWLQTPPRLCCGGHMPLRPGTSRLATLRAAFCGLLWRSLHLCWFLGITCFTNNFNVFNFMVLLDLVSLLYNSALHFPFLFPDVQPYLHLCPAFSSTKVWRLRIYATEKCVAACKPLWFLPAPLDLGKGRCQRLI